MFVKNSNHLKPLFNEKLSKTISVSILFMGHVYGSCPWFIFKGHIHGFAQGLSFIFMGHALFMGDIHR